MNRNICICIVIFAASFSQISEAKKGLGSIVRMGRAIPHNTNSNSNYETKIYNANTLSVIQIEKCLKLEKEIDEANTELTVESDILEKMLNKMQESQNNLEKVEKYLITNKNSEFHSQEELDKYNKAVKYYNDSADKYSLEANKNKKIEDEYNGRVSIFNQAVAKFSNECGGKSYYVTDMAIAKRLSLIHI